jgi:hypothetical protein
MDALPNRMDIARTTRKVVKWGYRVRNDEAEWGAWQPASSAAHAVELVKAERPEDEDAQALSSHRLYNQVGRGSRDGARKATRRPLPDHIEFRKV